MNHDTPAAPAPGICANCYGALAPTDRYCRHCGQRTRLHVPTLFEFVHEFGSHYVALDGGVLWRSLAALFLAPGKLAREYFAGRRGKYVAPLRLYLTASILFFVVIRVFGGDAEVKMERNVAAAEQPPVALSLGDGDALAKPWAYGNGVRLWLAKRLDKLEAEMKGPNRAEIFTNALRRFVGSMYYAMFLLLPIYAAISKLVYLNRGRTYGEHVVYALYSHAFLFFMLLLLFVLPSSRPVLVLPIVLWMLAYPYLELHRVFGGRHWAVFVRSNLIGVLYLLVATPVIGAFFLYSMLA